MNFYMLSYNTSALQPWNKTTYKSKADDKNTYNSSIMSFRRRNLSYQSYERAKQSFLHRKKSLLCSTMNNKNKVNLTTLTFFLNSDNGAHSNSADKSSIKKRNNLSILNKTRRSIKQDPQQIIDIRDSINKSNSNKNNENIFSRE